MLIVLTFLVNSIVLYAQPGGGGGPGPCTNPPCNPPNPPGLAPIDGGTLFLLGSGLIYGVSRLRRKEA
jgi:hypothetical protein